MIFHCIVCLTALTSPVLGAVHAAESPGGTLLFENLSKLVSSFRVDNPEVDATSGLEGPKGLAAADLDGDGLNDLVTGNHDGTIAVLFGVAGSAFKPVQYLTAGTPSGLRDVITADVSGDSRPEIIAAHPFDGNLYIFSMSGGAGSQSFAPLQTVVTWPGARAVVAADFDGDGKTDLAVGGAGGGFREYRGDGAGGFMAHPRLAAIPALTFDGISARPVFTLHAWKRPAETRHRLVLTYAGASSVWFLESSGPAQPLTVAATLPLTASEITHGVYDLAMGYITAGSQISGQPDLITAVTDSGEVLIRRGNALTLSSYSQAPSLQLSVPGGPRALSVTDVTGDGWPELLIVARQGNTISLYLNNNGTLSLSSQTSTGSSPRQVVGADFDGNGLPDAAVINRRSENVTVHRIDPAGRFSQSPLVQIIRGGATAPSIRDMDGDGRNELLYLAFGTGEANIQKLNTANGVSLWASPLRYAMGIRPRTLSAHDINGDGRLDLVSTTLGDTQNSGGLSYRLQLADHTFGPLITPSVPSGQGGAMFAEIARDFNGDGYLDLVVAFFDNKVAFFEGTAAGLVHRRTESSFVYAARALAAADLDQDGDVDLIGLGAYGDLVVVENDRRWFSGGAYRRTLISGSGDLDGAYGLNAEDLNGDGDPDLTIFSARAVSRWNGAPRLGFQLAGTILLEPGQDATELDFDGDGVKDRFVLSQTRTEASFYKASVGGKNTVPGPPVIFNVPSANELASGDLDNDGRPDLAGAGEYLWVALSGNPAPRLVAVASPQPPVEVTKVVINELLANTTDYIPRGSSKPVDCVEIFNGADVAVNLAGWRLRRTDPPEVPQKLDFIFPTLVLQPREMRVIYCTDKSAPWNAPFKLPEDGCKLSLVDASGMEVDSLTYPRQQPDISYARLFDGSRSFVYSPLPSIGDTNYDNGITPPKITFKGVDITLLKSGKWRFRARTWTPNGIFTLVVFWREITTSSQARSGSIPLFDDGMHDDGAGFDGTFAGDWGSPLPPGTPVEFYITGTDLRWESSTEPDSPQFAAAGKPLVNYTLSLPVTPLGWEISEVVTQNMTGLTDEMGRRPAWVELRYTGPTTVSVQDLFLADSLFENNSAKLHDMSRLGTPVAPNTVHVVFLDDTPFDVSKPRHAPFLVSTDGSGDAIYLIRRLPSGVTELVDGVKVPSLPADTAFARVRPGGPFEQRRPTPAAPNATAGGAVQIVPAPDGGAECLFVFRGGGSVEASSDLRTWTTVVPWISNNGIERVHRETIRSSQRFFRVR